MPTFAVGDSVAYCYGNVRELGTVTGVLGDIVGFTSTDNSHMLRAFQQGSGDPTGLAHVIGGVRYERPVGGSRLELVAAPFAVGNRVRYEWIPGSAVASAIGTVTEILDDGQICVLLDDGQRSRGSRIFLPNGTVPGGRPTVHGYRWGNAGSILKKLPVEPDRLAVGDRVTYNYGQHQVPGVVEAVSDTAVGVLFDDDSRLPGDRRSFRHDGRYYSGAYIGDSYYGASSSQGRIEKVAPVTFDDALDPQFEVGKAARYITGTSDSALGEIVKIDDQFIYLQLDIDCDTLGNVHQQRVFRRNGQGTGPLTVPEGCRHTDRSGKLTLAPPKWAPTPGREYPEEPRIGYGVFDGYNGRVLEEGNPLGYNPQVGWGVINLTTGCQSIYQTEEDAVTRGVLAREVRKWRKACYKVDLEALDSPFEVLMGLEIYRAWVYSDQIGFEVYMPEAINPVRRRVSVTFSYDAVLCVTGMMSMDDVNAFFSQNAGSMRVTAVDGEKLTINDTSFLVVPRTVANYKPPIITNDVGVSLQLLQNLAINPVVRDSEQQLAA